jgi:hypothetical protein
VTGTVDIEALRQFRVMNLNSNWMKDLRTEVFRRMYEQPIHPANLWMEQDPKRHGEVDKVYRANIRRLIDRGTFTPPAVAHKGAKYFPMGDGSQTGDEEWADVKSLWSDWEED